MNNFNHQHMSESSDNPVSQHFDTMIERFQLLHHSHNTNQQVHHVQYQQQQQQQQPPLQTNQSQQNTQVYNSVTDFMTQHEPDCSKSCNPANNRNHDNNNLDFFNDVSPSNDGESSSISADLVNSDDNLNISYEAGSVSYLLDIDSPPTALKKSLDKSSEEYKKRRARNNVAVRKSREKAKQRSKETEKKVSELQNENEDLKRTVDNLNVRMAALVHLLGTAGMGVDYIEDHFKRTST